MTDIVDFESLKSSPRSVDLADTFEFQQIQMMGVSLAVDPEARERIAAAKAAGIMGATAKTVVPALIEMLGQDRITAATGDLVERFKAGIATTADGHRAENMVYFAEADAACQLAAADALVALDTVGIAAVIAALKSPTTNIRVGAAKVLGRIGTAAAPAVDQLNEMAKRDSEEAVRKAAAEAVKQIRPKKWFSF